MKKAVAIILLTAAVLFSAAGCRGLKSAWSGDGQKVRIVTSISPVYDWVKRIAKDRAEVMLLLDNGVDMHSYQPTMDDIVDISDSDLFICVGGESEDWVDNVLAKAQNPDIVCVKLLEVLGDNAKEERTLEGMQDEDGEGEELVYDEHVWLSLKNAVIFCNAICDRLCEIDPDGAEEYRKNTEEYVSGLNGLEAQYEDVINNSGFNTLLFADRFPFLYLADDYGLECYAAFAGCSAESEASFDTLFFLSSKVDELDLPAIIKIETSDGKLAESVRDMTNKKDATILTLDSMQSTTSAEIDSGKTYFEIMKNNLEILKTALAYTEG